MPYKKQQKLQKQPRHQIKDIEVWGCLPEYHYRQLQDFLEQMVKMNDCSV